jgi:hypothetical protein
MVKNLVARLVAWSFLITAASSATASEFKVDDALLFNHTALQKNCLAVQSLITIEKSRLEVHKKKSIVARIETWCDSKISSALTEQLNLPASPELFDVISTWSSAQILGNPNGHANLAKMQQWFIANSEDSWARTIFERNGGKISALRLIEGALVATNEIDPIIESPNVSNETKQRLRKKLKELNDFRGSFNSPNDAAGR